MQPIKNKAVAAPRGIISLLAALIILASLSSCAPSLPLYLEVWDANLPATAGTGGASLLIQPFDAATVADKPIGELYGWQSSQQIKVDQQALAKGLTSKFERQIALQGLTSQEGSWDGTLAGIKKVGQGYRAVVSGTIRLLKIDSEKQGVQTVSRLHLVVDCRVGLPGQQRLLTPQVEINQEQTTILQQAAVLEDLLNQGLEEAAAQLAAKVKSALSSATPE